MESSLDKAISKYVSTFYPTDAHTSVIVNGYKLITDNKLESFTDEVTVAFKIPKNKAITIIITHLKENPNKLILLKLLEDEDYLKSFTTAELFEIRKKIIEDKFIYAREL